MKVINIFAITFFVINCFFAVNAGVIAVEDGSLPGKYDNKIIDELELFDNT